MDNIEKDINEIMEYIKDLKEENRKQKEILDILKPYFKGAIFPSAINFNFSPEELNLLKKEWLDGRD